MNSPWFAPCALALLLAALANAQTTPPPVDEVESLRQQAAQLKARNLKQAATAYEKVLEKCKERFGEKHLRTARIHLELGNVFHDLGAHAKAEPHYLDALAIREAEKGKNHPWVADVLNDLGVLYREAKYPRQAEARLLRCLEIQRQHKPKNDPALAQTLNTLGHVYLDLRQFSKAQQHYEESLAIRRANRSKHPTGPTQALSSLAVLYREMGQPERAKPLLVEALDVLHEAKLPSTDARIAIAELNLGAVFEALKQYERAEEHYRRCLAFWEANRGLNPPARAQAMHNLASICMHRRKLAEAEKLYTTSLNLREKHFGENHPEVAESLNFLAGACHAQEKYSRAETLYGRSLAIREARLGKDHPSVAETLNHLALLLQRRGDMAKAAEHLDQARRISRHHFGRVLPTLAERDQAALLASRERDDFERALCVQPDTGSGLTTRRDVIDVTRRAASWLLNGKALSQEAQARAVVLSRDARDPQLRTLATSLRAKREEIARLSLSGTGAAVSPAIQKRLDALKDDELGLSRKLAQAGSGAVTPTEWFDFEGLSKALPRGTVLIDVARIRSFDFKGTVGDRWGEERYVAWVTSPANDVTAVELGPAKVVDQAIKDVREALAASVKLIPAKGEAYAETELRKPLQRLSKLVYGKLRPHVENAERWVVSPDGQLWLIPWEMLLLADGRYAVERHTLSYVLSGRDLLTRTRFQGKTTRPLVVADPDFDLGKTSDVPSSDPLRRAERLEATRGEAKAIEKPLRAITGEAPLHLQGERALKSTLEATKHPRMLVLATHGFFRDQRKQAESPLVRCGLLFAGTNDTARPATFGILTGLEVLDMDLRGCEMVVLSACETGLGDVRAGEGVTGLRQAFRLAGAESVVSSLWKVPDKSSARLMALFFDGLAKGKGRAAALRDAQRKLIEERREERAVAHPLAWAAFTVTGSVRD